MMVDNVIEHMMIAYISFRTPWNCVVRLWVGIVPRCEHSPTLAGLGNEHGVIQHGLISIDIKS